MESSLAPYARRHFKKVGGVGQMAKFQTVSIGLRLSRIGAMEFWIQSKRSLAVLRRALLFAAAIFILFLCPLGCGGSCASNSGPTTSTTPIFDSNPAHSFQKDNGIFLNYGFMVNPMTDSQIAAVISWLHARLFVYQFLDVSALNSDGTMSSSQYAQLANWIRVSRATDPSQKIILYISGTLDLVNTPSAWPNIAAVCKMFITQYGADGINLDFEPYRTDSATEANYIGMFSAVRNAIGPKVNLSLDYTTDPDYTWSASFYKQASAYFTWMMPLVYDTSCTTVGCYNTLIDSALVFQYNNLAANTLLYPIFPAYAKSDTHDPAVENLVTSTSELWNLIGNNHTQVYGIGVWWYYDWDSTADTDWAAWLAHD